MATITLAAQLKCLKKPKTPVEDKISASLDDSYQSSMKAAQGPQPGQQIENQTKQAASSLQPLQLDPSSDQNSSDFKRYLKSVFCFVSRWCLIFGLNNRNTC
jgi:hypothetical protein